MLDAIRQGIEEVGKLPEGEKGPLEAWIYGWVVVNVVYYLTLGVVVILLGKRLITATMTAMAESQRVARQEEQGG